MVKIKAPLTIACILVAVVAAGVSAKGRSSATMERDARTARFEAMGPIRDVTKQPFSSAALLQPVAMQKSAAFEPAENARDGLMLTQQRFQRAGLGSQVRTSFTLVNRNAFAVKDVALRCEFAGPDGRYVSARQRVLPDTVRKASRKRVGPTHVGFVNLTMSQVRCAIASASRA